MNKIKFFLLVAILAMSSNVLNAQLRRAALISVYGNRNLTDNPLDKMANDSLFNLVPIVENFSSIINDELLKEFPFAFVPKDSVVNAPGYKALAQYLRSGVNGNTYSLYEGKTPYYNVSKGYIPFATFGIFNDTKALQKSFEVLPPDVDGVMVAYLNFRFVDQAGAFGITIRKVEAYANIKIFNRKGDRIFKLKDSEKSSKSLTAVMGFVAETSKVMPMIQDASEKLFEEMKKKMPKSIAKLAKKISAEAGEAEKAD